MANAPMPRVLCVDDEPEITRLIADYFGAHGFRVSEAHDAAQMWALLARGEERFDLMLLDTGLPDADGVALVRELRERWRGPVIIVSGRGEAVDRIVGLEIGADDYVAKPFQLRELLARARSVLRRAGPPAGAPEDEALVFAGWRIDPRDRALRDAAGREVALTSGEFDLLHAFARNPRRVLSRERLVELTRDRAAGPYDRAVDVQVGRLRRKLGDDRKRPRLIKSVRGAGYVLACDVKAARR